jgi:Fe-S cluster biosynthesis and repair protein YggX
MEKISVLGGDLPRSQWNNVLIAIWREWQEAQTELKNAHTWTQIELAERKVKALEAEFASIVEYCSQIAD